MKPFDIEIYKENPSREVVTRDGNKARIICTDMVDDNYPIVALIQFGGKEITQTYTELGYVIHGNTDPLDLFFASVKHKGWINIYKATAVGNFCGSVYETEELALANHQGDRVATIKIEWEE